MIIWIVAAYIQPIRLRYIEEDLTGKILRFSGWGDTSEGLKNFLMILQFNLKTYTDQKNCS